MNFVEFMESIKKHIKEYLPESYQDAHIMIQEQQKLNKRYMGLSVRRPEDTVIPTVDLTELYKKCKGSQEIHIGEVLQDIALLVQKEREPFDIDCLTDYGEAKKHLFMRVSDIDKNAHVLGGAPYVEREDLAITFHIAVEENEEGRASAIITNRMMENYGVTRNQLYKDALENSPVINPVRIENLGELLGRMALEEMKAMGASAEEILEAKDRMDETNQDNPLLVVTNETGIDGAAALFCPGVMDQIGEELKGDFFILPSSVHEMIACPDDGSLTYQELREMVTEINQSQVAPEDRLTDEVYHYDTKERVFEKAESFVERKRAKEQDIGKQESVKEPAKGKTAHSERIKHKSAEMSL